MAGNKILYSLLILFCLAAADVFAQEQNPDFLLKEAQRETNNKNYSKAISIAENAIKIAPGYIDISVLLGRLYMLNNEPSKARKQLMTLLLQDPGNLDALRYLMNIEAGEKNYIMAAKYADQSLNSQSSPDMILKKAGFLRSAGDLDGAAWSLRPLIATHKSARSEYLDLLLQSGKVSLARGDTITAENRLRNLLWEDPGNEGAINELFAISDHNKDYETALKYATIGLQYYPRSENFLFKRSAVLATMNQPFEAYQAAEKLTAIYPESEKGSMLIADLYFPSRRNRVGISYDQTFFNVSGPDAWRFISLFYLREAKYASLGARINIADRGFAGGDGFQVELEGYPKHRNGYSYIDLAYSEAIIFPRFRFAYSLYSPLKRNWEVELGMRFLKTVSTDFISFGGGVGKYYGKYWLNVRPFITLKNGDTYTSGTLGVRRYFTPKESYATVILGAGISPDDRGSDFLFDSRYNLESYSVTGGVQHLIFKSTLAGASATFNRQQITKDRRRNEFNINLSLQHKF